jgi:cytochrome P450
MADALTSDDPRYDELFDLRKETSVAETVRRRDFGAEFEVLLRGGPVQPASLRDLLDIPTEENRYAKVRPTYTALSFSACNAAFRDNETFSSSLYKEMRSFQMLGSTMIEMIGTEHRRCRGVFQPLFIKPMALTWWRARWIDEIIAALVDNLRDKDRTDLNLTFCARIPVHTVTRGIGMDGDDALTFREALLTMTGLKPAAPQEQFQGAQTVERMLFELIAKRRAQPGDDVISRAIRTEVEMDDGSKRLMTDAEIMANCRMIMLAGGGTTWRQLGITLWGLLSNPDQLEAVKADLGLVDAAVEESLRWNPTAPVFSRIVTRDAELDGTTIPAGSVLDIALGAANRDPARWGDPGRYEMRRAFQPNLGLGIGPHQCLGMNVAKVEMSVAVKALLQAFPGLAIDADAPTPVIVGDLELRGMTAVPVRLH